MLLYVKNVYFIHVSNTSCRLSVNVVYLTF